MKKLVRSVELLMPHVADKRCDFHQRMLRRMGKPWRADVLGRKHLVTPSPLILDIGANRGFFISAMETLVPQGRLVAFEPFPRLASLLRKRTAARDVRVEPVGLGAERGQLPLYVPVYRGMPLDTLASMHYEEAAGWLTAERIHWFDASKLAVERFVVDVRPLDDYGLVPDVVEMYAQRFEPEIIAGGARTLAEHQPAVLAPSHFPAGDKALRAIGYERFGYAGGTFTRESEGDYFSWYMTPKSLARLNAPAANVRLEAAE